VSYRYASAADLLADIHDQARKSLAERLQARAHPDVRAQLLPGITSYVKGLNDAQVAGLHAALDRTEP
jgi:hypothetical protein